MAKRTGIQLAYPFEEKRLERWGSGPVIVQPKLDGERCRTLVGSKPKLISSELNEFNFALPHLELAAKRLAFQIGRNVELDAELYVHDKHFEDIHSIVSRRTNLHPLHQQIQLHVFDIVDERSPQIDRLKNLVELSKFFPSCIKLVPSIAAEGMDEIRRVYDNYIAKDYEGIIVRHLDAPYVRKRSVYMMKFKPKKNDVYDIVDWVEGTGKYQGTIGALWCRGDDGTSFKVGSFSVQDSERMDLWNKRETLTQFACKVGYQHLNKGGKPKSGVFIELVEKEPTVNEVNPFF